MSRLYKNYQWAVVGAGPAGIAAVGSLLDKAIDPNAILWIDPDFKVGDFGAYWGDVSSNTTIQLFIEFLMGIKSFHYELCPEPLRLNNHQATRFVKLNKVTKPLQWITQQLLKKVNSIQSVVEEQCIENAYWKLQTTKGTYFAEKVILATGPLCQRK